MIRKIAFLLTVFSVVFFAPSCVSKKKYLEMTSSKQQADARIEELNTVVSGKNQRIEKMIADFEQMKNELLESNAIKDQFIDSLSGELNKLAKTVNVKESVIGEKETSFEFEKRRLTEDLVEQQKLVRSKQQEMNQLSDELKTLNENLSQLTFDLNREKGEKQVLQGNLEARDAGIAELNTATGKLKSEIQSLKKQLADKNETIKRLENNVQLLKKELK
ncbi:MAG: hypothetical protein WAO52_00825 [Prolixibacteraceae bacterium]